MLGVAITCLCFFVSQCLSVSACVCFSLCVSLCV